MQTRVKESGNNTADPYNIGYIEAAQAAEGKPRHIPAGSGSANNGSNLGVSVLNSNNVLSNANANYGSALANNIPIIAIMIWSYHGKWQQGDDNNTSTVLGSSASEFRRKANLPLWPRLSPLM